ncbi:transglutaminase domain-containing protein [Formosa sp. PL04]|uniref:transglutaminase-like domain-containing protein n=1 Tax=Formosa sp. PL04 TaxID=3081755 RepID=UPI0029826211|nr:transglutaminase domain-containing protein [Formosa sp. PL04]MDW5289113.1 transglutaminase domain-containing protein [Formosa sp. PL04]
MFNYTIKYTAENIYENPVFEAFWQYLVTPEDNATQELTSSLFKISEDFSIEKSINGYNFETTRIHCKKPFESIKFEAVFKLVKKEEGPLKIDPKFKVEDDYNAIDDAIFKIDNEASLNATVLTTLTEKYSDLFMFDKSKSILDNLKTLNEWASKYFSYKTDVTTPDTLLKEVIEKKQGVSKDFTHLFCAISRKNKIPARCVSGYLHQGDSLVGESKMHTWVEVFVPNLGWIGFDPTNNILTDHNYIKVADGRDYSECAPLKQILMAYGEEEVKLVVEVTYE